MITHALIFIKMNKIKVLKKRTRQW